MDVDMGIVLRLGEEADVDLFHSGRALQRIRRPCDQRTQRPCLSCGQPGDRLDVSDRFENELPGHRDRARAVLQAPPAILIDDTARGNDLAPVGLAGAAVGMSDAP